MISLDNQIIREGLDFNQRIKQYFDDLQNKFGTKLIQDISYINRVMKNKMNFTILCIELMFSPFKFKKMIYTQGWKKTYKSSKDALEKIRVLHNNLFEGIFTLVITQLITYYAILKDYFLQMKKELKKEDPRLTAGLIIKEYDEYREAILMKEEDYKLSELEKKSFLISPFRKNVPNDKSILSYKTRFLKSLKKNKNFRDIKPAIGRLDIDHWREMKIYNSFFKNCLYHVRLDSKLDFLKEKGFDFYPWCDKLYRNKNTHHLNTNFIKDKNGLCAIKIITGNFRNRIITLNELYDVHCKLAGLSKFLFSNLQYWGINLSLRGLEKKIFLPIKSTKKSLEDSNITFPS